MYILDLPYEVASDDVIDFFSSYGKVLTAERSVAAKFPNLCNGNRIIKMILNKDLPYVLSVCGCQCRVWYRGQPIHCFVCRALGHPLSGRCRYCHQVGHMTRECAQAWDPLRAAVDADDSSMSDSATVIEDDRVPESDHVNIIGDPDPKPAAVSLDPVPAAVKDKPSEKPDPVPDKVPVADPVKVSEKPPDKTPAVATDDDMPMPAPTKPRAKSSPAGATAKVFCARLSKSISPLKFPDFGATGKEWDSKAKAHLRLQVKTVFSSRDIAISNSDLLSWSENDLRDVSNLFCEMLSVRQEYLVDFVFGIVKSYWNNAKKAVNFV